MESETITEQPFLSEEMTPPSIKELDVLIAKYVKHRDVRMKALDREVEMKQEILELMHTHELLHYKHNGFDAVRVPGQEKLKVKELDQDNAGEE